MRIFVQRRKVLVRVFRLACISILVSAGLVSLPTTVQAVTSAGAGGTINIGPGSTVTINSILPGSANDIQALGFGNETITATISTTNGSLQITNTTNITGLSGYQSPVSAAASTIAFYGLPADVNNALNSLQFVAPGSTGSAAVTVSISDRGSGTIAYEPTTGVYYQYVSTAVTWDQAYNAITGDNLADQSTVANVTNRQSQTPSTCPYKFDGMCGYFATIENSAQNSFVNTKVGSNQAWLGGSDRYYEGKWVWADPKAPAYNLQFSDQSSHYGGRSDQTGSTHSGTGPNTSPYTGAADSYTVGSNSYSYVYWNGGEPNNSGANENALQMLSGSSGNWNDLQENSGTMGYVVEYGGNGETLTYPAATSNVNINIAYVPTVYLATTNGSSNVTYRTATSLTATINPAGKITFYANGKAIPGCKNMNASVYTATCSTWKPSQQNTIKLTATLLPTNGSYSSGTSPVVVVTAAPRSTLR